MTRLLEFSSGEELAHSLAAEISSSLQGSLARKDKANLAVSGGQTPVNLFSILAESPLDWSRINVTLADERWVSPTSVESNERLVRETLLKKRAAAAHFIPLKRDGELAAGTLDVIESQLEKNRAFPFDVLTLGMGEDGHTASLFPCAENINQAMADTNKRLLTTIIPGSAPYVRISFTLQALLQSRRIFLHLTGERKLAVLNRARAGDNVMEMPIRAFLQRPELDFSIYWSPD